MLELVASWALEKTLTKVLRRERARASPNHRTLLSRLSDLANTLEWPVVLVCSESWLEGFQKEVMHRGVSAFDVWASYKRILRSCGGFPGRICPPVTLLSTWRDQKDWECPRRAPKPGALCRDLILSVPWSVVNGTVWGLVLPPLAIGSSNDFCQLVQVNANLIKCKCPSGKGRSWRKQTVTEE